MPRFVLVHIRLISYILIKYHKVLERETVFGMKRKDLKDTDSLFKKDIKKI